MVFRLIMDDADCPARAKRLLREAENTCKRGASAGWAVGPQFEITKLYPSWSKGGRVHNIWCRSECTPCPPNEGLLAFKDCVMRCAEDVKQIPKAEA